MRPPVAAAAASSANDSFFSNVPMRYPTMSGLNVEASGMVAGQEEVKAIPAPPQEPPKSILKPPTQPPQAQQPQSYQEHGSKPPSLAGVSFGE